MAISQYCRNRHSDAPRILDLLYYLKTDTDHHNLSALRRLNGLTSHSSFSDIGSTAQPGSELLYRSTGSKDDKVVVAPADDLNSRREAFRREAWQHRKCRTRAHQMENAGQLETFETAGPMQSVCGGAGVGWEAGATVHGIADGTGVNPSCSVCIRSAQPYSRRGPRKTQLRAYHASSAPARV
jgi:hypothetical protein